MWSLLVVLALLGAGPAARAANFEVWRCSWARSSEGGNGMLRRLRCKVLQAAGEPRQTTSAAAAASGAPAAVQALLPPLHVCCRLLLLRATSR